MYALERDQMLIGGIATFARVAVADALPGWVNVNRQLLVPVDADGAALPPVGSPVFFVKHVDQESHFPGSLDPDVLEIWEMTVNWNTNTFTAAFAQSLAVGLGTLVIETLFMGENINVIGFGGDLVLTKEGLGPVAADFVSHARQSKDKSRSCADLIAWDACCLPIRAQSVDVIVSDLPFGQSCSSSSKLEGFLPMLVCEWARVLRPHTGRMVLLCGTYSPLLQAMVEANEHHSKSSEDSPVIWQFPHCSFPREHRWYARLGIAGITRGR